MSTPGKKMAGVSAHPTVPGVNADQMSAATFVAPAKPKSFVASTDNVSLAESTLGLVWKQHHAWSNADLTQIVSPHAVNPSQHKLTADMMP